jgi:hypothetical protein
VLVAFERLGVTFTQEEARQVFQESDMLETGRLNFKEFLVCLAIGFVLHVRADGQELVHVAGIRRSHSSLRLSSASRRSRASASASSTPPCASALVMLATLCGLMKGHRSMQSGRQRGQ